VGKSVKNQFFLPNQDNAPPYPLELWAPVSWHARVTKIAQALRSVVEMVVGKSVKNLFFLLSLNQDSVPQYLLELLVRVLWHARPMEVVLDPRNVVEMVVEKSVKMLFLSPNLVNVPQYLLEL